MGSKGELFGGAIGVALTAIPGIGMGAHAITAMSAFMMGSAVGGMLAPNDMGNSELGKLSDVRGSGSSQGVGIPYVFGRQRVGGVVIYQSQVREAKKNQGGGGKK
jgi:transposase